MKFIDLKQHLNTTKHSSCYVIFGDDEQVLLLAENLFKNIIDESLRDFNTVVFEEDNLVPQKVVDACNTMPLMANKKLVIVKDEFAKEEKPTASKNSPLATSILEYLKNPNLQTILVVKTNEGSALFNKLKTVATFVDCNKLDTVTIKKIILNECRKKKANIADSEILKLIEICNFNLGSILTELNKLISVSNNGVITQQIIEENCTKNLEYSVYELTEAISLKNTEKTFAILEDMLNNSKAKQSILPLIAVHFRRLFMVATSMQTTSQKAKDLGIKEFAVQKLEGLAKRFNKKKLMDTIKLINNTEFLVKSGKAGLTDSLYSIVLYILNS